MLSRIAQEMADEIRLHDWSDSPWRIDRAGHQVDDDPLHRRRHPPLGTDETLSVRVNVMFVTAQVLAHADPNLDLAAFALACGLPRRLVYNGDGRVSGFLRSGLRWNNDVLAHPGERQ